MQRLKYINPRGVEIDFTSAAPFVFWKIDGLSLPEAIIINTQAAGQNGFSAHSVVMEERYIKLTGHIHGKTGVAEMYALRQKMSSALNPSLGPGVIVYENDYGKWKIDAICTSAPYLDKVRNIQTLNVNFTCPSPYFLSSEPLIILLSYVEGGLEFPVVTPGYFGTLGYLAEVDNDSNDDLPIEMLMEGGAVNPVITNKTTGEFIKLTKDIPVGEKLYVNTNPEELEVSLIYIDPSTNKEKRINAYGYLTADSTLLKMKPGTNELTFTSDDETKKVKIKITIYKRYAGV